jgi:hypothetical protein
VKCENGYKRGDSLLCPNMETVIDEPHRSHHRCGKCGFEIRILFREGESAPPCPTCKRPDCRTWTHYQRSFSS